MRSSQTLACLLSALSWAGGLLAQTPEQLQAFHDQATELIVQLASRPLTPGDTLLTFNPEPGGLIHTVRVSPSQVESSLLRADRMMGTAHVEWVGASVGRFAVLWTRADTLRGSEVDSAITVSGQVDGDSIRIATPDVRTMALPTLPWAIADFGMEEQLIPIFRSLPSGQSAQRVAILRPYHLRWDTVTVSVRDSAGLRMAVTYGSDKAHEVWIIDQDGRLLYVRRVDQAGDRIPLPTSACYEEMLQHIDAIRALLAPFPVAPPKSP
jgi:hypothetical protein